jgi:hypothetical protein
MSLETQISIYPRALFFGGAPSAAEPLNSAAVTLGPTAQVLGPTAHVINEAAQTALEEHWQRELAASPEARAAFGKLLAEYTAWLRARRGVLR